MEGASVQEGLPLQLFAIVLCLINCELFNNTALLKTPLGLIVRAHLVYVLVLRHNSVQGLRRSRLARLRGHDPAGRRLQPGREDQQEGVDDDPTGSSQAQPGGGAERIDPGVPQDPALRPGNRGVHGHRVRSLFVCPGFSPEPLTTLID